MECKYCGKIRELFCSTNGKGDAFLSRDLLHVEITKTYDSFIDNRTDVVCAEFKFNNCPICGRKLKG